MRLVRSAFELASCSLAALGLLGSLAVAQVRIHAERVPDAPILSPQGQHASFGIFNPAAARVNGKTILLLRAQDAKKTSRILYAESDAGGKFQVSPTPAVAPELPFEKDGGVEDPRLVQIDGLWYLTYTGYNTKDAQLCLSTSRDLRQWKPRRVILPAYKGSWNTGWTKSGAILPQKVNGKWWMYYLGTRTDKDGKTRDYMGVASSPDLVTWKDASDQPVLDRRPGAFDSRVMEPGPAPMMTSAGILLLYNGADDRLVYSPGWVLFDAKNPARVVARSDGPFLKPERDWEKNGNVPNVIFLEGAILERHQPASAGQPERFELTGYYGGADRVTASMKISIEVHPSH